jgi:hypothetical protein
MSIYPNYPDPQEREQEESKQDAITERKENERIEEKIKAMNVLENGISQVFGERELWDFENTLNIPAVTDKLYQLTEDVSIAYENWKTEESSFTKRYSYDDDNNGKWYDEFDNSLGRKYYTDKQLFQYFLNNIYKP